MNKRYIDFVPVRPTIVKPRPAVKIIDPEPDDSSDIIVEQTEIEIIKSQKIVNHSLKAPAIPTTQRQVPDTMTLRQLSLNTEFKTPAKSPFINTNNVSKRPLSKNVYEKPTPTKVPESTKPVTIISKPEKDSRASLVITIILTIIFGAAIGTVAFLLLPR